MIESTNMNAKIYFYLIMLLTTFLATSAKAAPLQLKNYHASYIVRYDEIPFAHSNSHLVITKTQYQLCINAKTTLPFLHGTLQECSNGLIKNTHIIPLHYQYKYTRNNTHKNIDIVFDWKKNIAIINTGTYHWTVALLPNTQDKVSYELLLRQGLSEGKTFFSFPVADGGNLKTYQFKFNSKFLPHSTQALTA